MVKQAIKRAALAVLLCAFAVCLALGISLLVPQAQSAYAEETDPNVHTTHDSSWQRLSSGYSSGRYYLGGDHDRDMVINGDVTLCLNGHILRGTGKGPVITVSSGAKLTLCDCQSNVSRNRYTVDDTGLYIINNGNTGIGTLIAGGIITGGKLTERGGGIYVDSNATFVMEGGTIAGNTASNYGGGVYLNYNSTFNMNGGTIVGNTVNDENSSNVGTRGGGVCAIGARNGVFTMSGNAAISNNTAISKDESESYGGGVFFDGPIFEISGNAKISGNVASWGGGIDVVDFVMSDNAQISDNRATDRGGVNCYNFTMNDGTISDNRATDRGGVNCYNFTMNGGTISGNTATEAGGVNVYGDTFTMNGGEISGNTATDGYSVWARCDNFTINGGYFGEGENEIYYIPNNGTVNIYGGYFADRAAITDNSWLVNATVQPISSTADDVNYKDGYNYAVYHQHTDEDGTTTFKPMPYDLSSWDGSLSGGYYYLPYDVTLTNNITISGTVTLCLNGHILRGNGNGSVITVNSGTFTLCDCNGSNGEHDYYINDSGLYVVDDGTEDWNTAYDNAKTTNTEEQPTIGTITGGVITGGTGTSEEAPSFTYGGGVYVAGTFNMESGAIAGNTAVKYGGGVYVDGGTITMNGGEISGNTVEEGGGVYMDGGTFTMNGGKITGNTAEDGGGLYILNNNTFIMKGGKITGNTAECGGGVYVGVSSGTNTMEGGTISDNTATGLGGGICVYHNTFTMQGGTISSNTARISDGGVYVVDTFTMNGGYFGANEIYKVSSGTVTITGGYFASDPTSYVSAGYINGSTHTVVDISRDENHYGDEDYLSGYPYAVYLTGQTPDYDVADVTATYGNDFEPQILNNTYNVGVTYSYISDGQTINGLPENAGEYTVTAHFAATVVTGTDGTKTFYPGDDDVTFTVNIGQAQITGSVTISGSAVPGGTLTANYTDGASGETYSYQWYLSDMAISGATGSTYQPQPEEVGREITVTVSGTGNYSGNKTSSPVIVGKGSQDAPASGVGYTIDYFAETISADEGYELAASGTAASGSNSLNLTPGTNVYVRLAGTSSLNPSPWTAVTVPARPAATAPTLSGTAGADGFTVTAVSGQMYAITTENTAPSITDSTAWSAATGSTFAFDNLNAGEVYYVWTYTPYGTNSFNSPVTAALTVNTLPVITTETLGGGTYGDSFSAALAAESVDTVTWSIASGSLPEGLTLEGNVISGTPTAANVNGATFTVRATVNGVYAEKSFTIVVAQRNITVTISGASSDYGNSSATLSATVTSGSIVEGDTAYSLSCEVTAASDVGFYDITGKVENDNYAVTFVGGTEAYEVEKRDITVIITSNGGTYGAVTAATSALQNLVNDDTPAITLTYTGTDNAGNEYSGTTAPTNAGNYTVTASITDGNYNLTGDVTAKFVIEKADYDMRGISFADATYTYNGTERTLVITGTLPTGVTVEYTTNTLTNAGSIEVTASFTGDANNYNAISDMTATLKIDPKNISGADIVLGTSLTYDGTAQQQTIASVTVDGLTVTYNVSGNVETNAGNYVLTITGTGNFIGTATADWSIAKKNISGADIELGASLTYDGTAKEQTVESVTVDGLTVTYNVSGNVETNAGDYTLTVTGTGNFIGTATADWSIAKRALTADMFQVTGSYTYTGTGREATYTFSDEGGNLAATDFEVSYSNNVNAGNSAVITFTATDSSNYSGSVSLNFTIEKATYDMSGVSFGNATYTYDGSEKTLAISGTLPGGVTVSYTNNGHTNAGTYTVTASFTGNANYNDIADMTATLTINKATYNMSGVSFNDAAYTYDSTEKTLVITGTLPSGVTVTYTTNTLTNAGSIEVTATFTGDTANYNAIPSMTATLTINKATYDMSGVSFADATYTYDGSEKTLVITGNLPDGVTVSYTTNTLTNAGSLEVTATFTGDADNYNAIADMTASLTIEKAVPAYTLPEGITAITGQTLDEIELPDGWSWVEGSLTLNEEGEYTMQAVYTPDDTDNYDVVTVEINVTVEQATDNTIHYIIWGCITGIAIIGIVIGCIIVVCVKKHRAKTGK